MLKTATAFRFILLAAPLLRAAAAGEEPRPVPDRVAIVDHGRARLFEVARDELAVIDGRGREAIRRMARKNTAEEARREAARLGAATGSDVRLVLYEAGEPRKESGRRILSDEVLVRLADGASAEAVARAAGARGTGGRLPYAPDRAVFLAGDSAGTFELAQRLKAVPGVLEAEPLLARRQYPRVTPNDTYFGQQWHLRNTGQNGGAAGVDVNVTNVWDTRTGTGIVIGIVDDGVEIAHPDLAAHANTAIDWDYNGNDANPAPVNADDNHGTAVAGVALGVGMNAAGVAGSAYNSTLVALRLTAAAYTEQAEAAAMAHSNNLIHIKNCSWGPAGDGETLEGPGSLTQAALADGVTAGRGGKGTIYVWACGNGAVSNDNVNYDGYANSIYVIAVGATDDQGQRATYSEPGACLLCVAPSGDDYHQGITTTDWSGANGYNTNGSGDLADLKYTEGFGGTSASAPLTAGVIALMLEARPQLGWRDVKEILIRTARKTDPGDADWTNNAAGFHFNHDYGAGLVDARAAVSTAGIWTALGTWTNAQVAQTSLSVPIPDNNPAGITRAFDFHGSALRVEEVEVSVDIAHEYRGDLAITLVSPSGTRSRLAEKHSDKGDNYSPWTFTSVRNWGERSEGVWTVKVADMEGGSTGVIHGVTVKLYGTSQKDPVLEIASSSFSDAAGGNGNGFVDPGETPEETVVLRNAGNTNAAGVSATLSATSPGVTVLNNTASYGWIAVGQTATNASKYSYRVAKTVPAGALLTFRHVAQTAAGKAFTNSFARRVGWHAIVTATNTYASPNVPRAIPDGQSVVSSNAVPAPGIVADVDVAVRIDHTWDSDLDISIRHPDSTKVLLATMVGDAGDNFGTGTCGSGCTPTWFDDEAATDIESGVAPFAGSFRPDGNLSSFDGKAAAGTWVLRVEDLELGDEGTLLCWSLRLTTTQGQYFCQTFNMPPVASNLAMHVTTGTPTVIKFRGADPDGDAVTYGTNGLPSHGTLSGLNPAAGTVTYKSAGAYVGSDTFTYRANDGYTNSPSATVNLSIVRFADSDGDGLPDGWETAHGLDPNDDGLFGGDPDNGASGNPDGDMATNIREYEADTDPTNSHSVLALTNIVIQAGGARIGWKGGQDARQLVEKRRSVDGASGQWAAFFTNQPPTAIHTNLLDAAATNRALFYRIRVERPD
jgi:subtilisin-like proprotein convertase family protein/subtilisin family serine protease